MKSCGLSNCHQGDTGIAQSPSGDAQVFGRKGMMPHVLGAFRGKHSFWPQPAPAPPGAGRDSMQQCIKREVTGLWLCLAPGVEKWLFAKGHTTAHLPGRAREEGRDVAGDGAHPLCNIRPKSMRQFGSSSPIAS